MAIEWRSRDSDDSDDTEVIPGKCL